MEDTNIGIKGRVGGGWEGLEKDAVPVVADSRSEELTDGQETPFLPPSATSRLGCPTKALWAASYNRSHAIRLLFVSLKSTRLGMQRVLK